MIEFWKDFQEYNIFLITAESDIAQQVELKNKEMCYLQTKTVKGNYIYQEKKV